MEPGFELLNRNEGTTCYDHSYRVTEECCGIGLAGIKEEGSESLFVCVRFFLFKE